MSTADSLARLADAAERIATALEQMARVQSTRPLPDVVIARSPGDVSPLPPATLRPDGTFSLLVQNLGEAPCTLLAPTLRAGHIEIRGAIIGEGSRPIDEGVLPAAPGGPGCQVTFELGTGSHLLTDEELSVEVPYRNGPYPGVTVRDFVLTPQGPAGGRHGFAPRAVRLRAG